MAVISGKGESEASEEGGDAFAVLQSAQVIFCRRGVSVLRCGRELPATTVECVFLLSQVTRRKAEERRGRRERERERERGDCRAASTGLRGHPKGRTTAAAELPPPLGV